MKILKNIGILSFSAILFSCNKEIKSEKGGIDIISNVYYNASKGLNNMKSFHVSRLNYSNDTIVEIIPDLNMPQINIDKNLIIDSLYYNLGILPENLIISDLIKNHKPTLIWKKKGGAVFSKETIPNYLKRKNLKDTLLFKKNYKRFEVNSPWSFTRYYIYPTDTILPYSMYKHAEKDYGGRLERIDSYNKKLDMFVSIQMIPRKKWDDEALDFFSFNNYAKKSVKK